MAEPKTADEIEAFAVKELERLSRGSGPDAVGALHVLMEHSKTLRYRVKEAAGGFGPALGTIRAGRSDG